MAEWQELKDIDFYAMESPRIGIKCINEEMLDDFLEQFRSRSASTGGDFLLIDYRGCSTSDDFQKKIVDSVSQFVNFRFPDKAEGLTQGPLNQQASNCLGVLEEIAEELRKQFTLVVDFRGIKISPEMLRPGQIFWWAYDSAGRCRVSNLIWIMEDDEKGISLLEKHGQMKRVFSDEGTSTYIII